MPTLEKNAQHILELLKKAGHEAYFAGGFVRDKILKRKTHDIDIATSAKPTEVIKILEKNSIKHLEIGAAFGVIAAVIGKQMFEIATFREDHGTTDHRHPASVTLGVTAQEDALRRDFTINGMFASSTAIKNKDAVIDYVAGLQDIQDKTIRFIGEPEERIKEDALRLMRAIRFATQLNFYIEDITWNAIRKHASDINTVSSERIRDELNKILLSENAAAGFVMLKDSGLLHEIMPEFDPAESTAQPPNHHAEGNVWNHILLTLRNMHMRPALQDKNATIRNKAKKDIVFYWSVLMHDVAKPHTVTYPEKGSDDRIRFSGHDSVGATMATDIMKRLKFSNDDIDKVAWLVKFHLLQGTIPKMREARRLKYLGHPYFGDLLELFWVDANSSLLSKNGKILPPNLSAYFRNVKFYKEALANSKNKKILPKKIVDGHIIMKAMGISRGTKEVGEIMNALYDMQLEKKFKNKKEGLVTLEAYLKKQKKNK
ncbi:MAG: CCA tRNA nucleotidyltransferase [Patescibacteria group bacterium]